MTITGTAPELTTQAIARTTHSLATLYTPLAVGPAAQALPDGDNPFGDA